MIDFAVPARNVVPALGWNDQIVGRAARSEGSRIVWCLPGIPRQNVLGHGIKAVLRDYVARERVAHPGAVLKPRGGGVVDREAPSAEVEVSGIHFRAGNIADKGLRDFFVMALEAGEEKRLVLAVIQSRDRDAVRRPSRPFRDR